MPELPEVETVVRGISPWLEGEVIQDVRVHKRQLRYPIPENFEEFLIRRCVMNITRRSKYIIIHLDKGYLLIHLGMSGSVRQITGEPIIKHDHIEILTERTHLVYHDPRRFGAMDIGEGDPLAHKWFRNLGPEPLGNTFNATYLAKALSQKTQAIKQALLDQSIIAGIGNIYASEALWRAQIHPLRPSKSLSGKEIEALIQSIRTVLLAAIESGGSTLRDHRQASGELGYFQHSFNVYGHQGDLCQRQNCGGHIENRKLGQRSTFFCSKCQN